jgi:uncharacterized protein
MRSSLLLIILLAAASSVFSQAQPANEKNIRKLMQLTGAGELGLQAVDNMIATFRKQHDNIDDEFWTEMRKELRPETLVDLVVPIYAKYFTDDEILGLIRFYETPLGKKVTSTLPAVMNESMTVGGEWGRELGEKIVNKMKLKGYVQNN